MAIVYAVPGLYRHCYGLHYRIMSGENKAAQKHWVISGMTKWCSGSQWDASTYIWSYYFVTTTVSNQYNFIKIKPDMIGNKANLRDLITLASLVIMFKSYLNPVFIPYNFLNWTYDLDNPNPNLFDFNIIFITMEDYSWLWEANPWSSLYCQNTTNNLRRFFGLILTAILIVINYVLWGPYDRFNQICDLLDVISMIKNGTNQCSITVFLQV